MKKNKLLFIIIFSLMLLVVPIVVEVPSAKASGISINVNGSDIPSEDSPIIYNGTTLVPLSVLQDVLNISLSWDNTSKMLTAVKGDVLGVLKIDNPVANIKIGDEKNTLTLTQPPMIINNRVMAPVRFISELFGAEILWDATMQTIFIQTETSPSSESENPGENKNDVNSNGIKGDTGATGPQGDKGDKGDTGATGSQGSKGNKGDTGATGSQGSKGDKGDTGATGPKGEKGDSNATGSQGSKGDKGDTGATGSQGDKGDKGDTGAAGSQGDPGPVGPMGPQGPQGAPGPAGPMGPQGPQGDPGPAGGTNNANVGFSASSTTMDSGTISMNWNVQSPYYSSSDFDPATGIFTTPETGKYAIKATVNYKTHAAANISLGREIDPMFTVKLNGNTDLIMGYLPILDVNIALVLTMRTILSSATVTLVGDVELQAGDQVELYYEDDGLTLGFDADIVWSIHQLSTN
ncbi:stalk domain-containing protein [Solibacillus sp. FSL K6-1523]|uniref:stalk domain-containing protein n=1 Tax=Solibacillus sp. FSL K6-1523 TaxID=2921471 RepID=UPI0030F6519C